MVVPKKKTEYAALWEKLIKEEEEKKRQKKNILEALMKNIYVR
jgi:hypothetical protein